MSNPDQKIAIVTGGSRGIGAAISRRLATDGFAVVVNYAGNEKAALDVVAGIEAAGGRALAARADVSNPAEVARLFDSTEQSLGVPSVLVNSAGVLELAPIAEMTDDQFDRLVDINLKGTFNTLREAARRMQDGGRIVNLSTSVVGTKLPRYGVYTATKAAVESLTGILANELRGRTITVNTVAPGPVATSLFFKGKSPELIDQLARMAPLERLGEPEDIAGAVAFLAGPDGGWINGQTLRANGGLV